MDSYTIPCTKEQIKKAFKLGAPIAALPHAFYLPEESLDKYKFVDIANAYLKIPTAEQMIDWLEDKGIQISIIFSYRVSPKRWNYDLDNNNKILFEHNSMGYSTRKEAVLAAIDAALDYLINNKK